jgi:hypothetical protein
MQTNERRTKVYATHEPTLPESSSWTSVHGTLDPSTAPDAINASHLAEVREAVEALRAAKPPQPIDVAKLSDLLCLPRWNVKRHLEALGIHVDAVDDRGQPILTESQMLSKIRKAIGGETLGTVTVAKRAGLPVKLVREFMKARPKLFVSSMANGKSALMWRLQENSFGGLGSGNRSPLGPNGTKTRGAHIPANRPKPSPSRPPAGTSAGASTPRKMSMKNRRTAVAV